MIFFWGGSKDRRKGERLRGALQGFANQVRRASRGGQKGGGMRLEVTGVERSVLIVQAERAYRDSYGAGCNEYGCGLFRGCGEVKRG